MVKMLDTNGRMEEVMLAVETKEEYIIHKE